MNDRLSLELGEQKQYEHNNNIFFLLLQFMLALQV